MPEMTMPPPPEPLPRPMTPTVVPPQKRSYQVDGREVVLLPLCWLLGVLLIDLFLTGYGVPGLGVTVLVLCWYGVLLWYRGAAAFAGTECRLLLGAVLVLALTFTLFSNQWLRVWNLLALALLMAVQLFAGAGGHPWYDPAMLLQRLALAVEGGCGNWGAPVKALASIRGLSHRRTPYVLGGLCVGVVLLIVVVPTLMSADALFRSLTAELVDWIAAHFSFWLLRLFLGLLLAPLAFGLLYALRRPRQRTAPPQVAHKSLSLEAAAPITVLVLMDVLYGFFLAVQFSALFGGEVYLLRAGLSYAEYARSGFFQLVAVAALNLTLVLIALWLCKGEGRGRRVVQVLCTALVGMSGALLASAALRMSLYVAEYGLSFKRLLTYWGMAMLAFFFAAALLKIWKKGFRLFRVLFVSAVAGWLVLNLMNVDGLVTRYNLYRGLDTDALASAAVGGDGYLNDASLPLLAEGERPAFTWYIENSAQRAAQRSSPWENWSLSTHLAANAVEKNP